MQIKDILAALALLASASALPTALPADFDPTKNSPVDGIERMLFRRLGDNSGRDPANARNFREDCTNLPHNCDMNAFMIICRGRSSVQRRNTDKSNKKKHYTRSGASSTPFVDQGTMDGFHVTRLQNGFGSAEEYPYEGCDVEDETNRRVGIAGVPKNEQDEQGHMLSAEYTRQHIDNMMWFNIIRFDNCNEHFCMVFNGQAKLGKDDCDKPPKQGSGILNWVQNVYEKTSKPNTRITFSSFIGTGNGQIKRRDVFDESELDAALLERDVVDADAVIVGENKLAQRDLVDADAVIVGENTLRERDLVDDEEESSNEESKRDTEAEEEFDLEFSE